MSDELVAQFEKAYHRGPVVHGDLRMSATGFSITVLFGPSGCGKTTLLRCLAGLERPESGTIRFNGLTWFDSASRVSWSPQRRDVGFLFQEYALFPHLTVGENIAFGLRNLRPEERRRAVADMLDRFQLDGLEGRFPHQVSGGQQQRVALARMLVRRPRLLFLDEPLSALDAALRDELRSQLRHWLSEFAIPVVVVTHDRTEAIALADQVVVMQAGQVRQTGSVEEVFSRPVDSDVARIVGVETVELGEVANVSNGLATIHVKNVSLIAIAPTNPVHLVHVCIKGEDVVLQRETPERTSVRNHLPGMIRWMTPEGPLVRIGLDCGFALTALVTRPACEELQLQVGERIVALLKAPSIHLIPKD